MTDNSVQIQIRAVDEIGRSIRACFLLFRGGDFFGDRRNRSNFRPSLGPNSERGGFLVSVSAAAIALY